MSKSETDYVHELQRILAVLRSPEGCPWDREQTHESLKPYLVEEAAEFFDALDDGDDSHMADELGDVLLQIVFHCQIAAEENRFDLQTAARLCCEKMIRRHPHVFADARVADSNGVVDQWETIKRAEKGEDHQPVSVLDGVPRHLPALHRARKLQGKAAKVGFDWPAIDGVLAKIDEELEETREALRERDQAKIAEEIGDLLFAVVNLSRFCNECPEQLLHGTIRKFECRFQAMEAVLADQGATMTDRNLEQLEELWQRAKQNER